MTRRLGEHRSFAPFSRHADASLLVCPVIHLIAPLANPQGLAAVVSRVLHIPSFKAWNRFTNAVAGGIAAFDRELLMNDTVKIRRHETVVCLVELGFPQQHAGMVTVAAYHLTRILVNTFSEQLVSHELPSRIGDDGQNAKLVARIHEGRVLGVMAAIRSETRLTQLDRVAVMRRGRQCVANIRMVLMAIGAEREEILSVDFETFVLINVKGSDAYARELVVDYCGTRAALFENRSVQQVEIGALRMP